MSRVTALAVLYVMIAGLPVPIMFFTAYVDKISRGEIPVTHWAVWVLLALSTISAMTVALRAYLDGSAERKRQTDQFAEPVKPTETTNENHV